MTKKTLAENVETAAKVIKEVKETIVAKGVEIPEGTHATEYPVYIERMRSETDFSELEERLSVVEDDLEGVKGTTVWGQPLSPSITGNLSGVGYIHFASNNSSSIGTNDKRPSAVYVRGSVRTGDVNSVGDGNGGAFINDNGLLALSSSPDNIEEDKHPRIVFLNGGTNYLSSIREAYPGVISIPNKVSIGETAREDQESTLSIKGKTLFKTSTQTQASAHFGSKKTVFDDGENGVSIYGDTPYIALSSSEDSTDFSRIAFLSGDKVTSRVAEGYPGVLSLQSRTDEGTYVGNNIRSASLNGDKLYVDGTSYFAGNITALSLNDIPLTSSGNGTQFLADDGRYHDLQLNNYLPSTGGSMSGKLWMHLNKIHLGSYGTGVSGLSYVSDRGVLLESASDGTQSVGNIELYSRGEGNIILNTTDGKALYKDAEIATSTDITALQNEISTLKQQIAELLAAR